ncbi:hypothetical protein DSM110277_03737 (plasmid) [Sulfitobacter pontiacus]|uniref:Integrase catalytic domain-containing protein n=1 Tax=Sulfitobacter pontiacus TaxID=60137 RepID=A0AAX3AJL2_9RHOB|nr:hypothetical protein DSM110277_03737 [Sulfitobacter pontiacus]
MILLAHIREQHRLSLGSYGRPRMTQGLKEQGLQVGQRRVARIMRDNGIQVLRSRKFKRTTDSDHSFNIARNLLSQNFSAAAPNQKCAGDITYIWTREGWAYLSGIIDLYSRRVIGWAISNRMKQNLALRTLDMAIALRRPPPGCIHHTDRGAQYCAHEYQKRLRRHKLLPSMSGKGNCYDNSAVESFFKSLKAELIWRNTWQTRCDVEVAVFEYINGFDNPRRRHSALDGKSPLAFESNHRCYGYRRLEAYITRESISISEKVGRCLMKQETLIVPKPKRRRYSSYRGEISPAPENIINREFQAAAPNEKWLTDVTEFHFRAGKVNLSPIIDCFDGLVISWTIGVRPDADLVNTMLDAAVETIADSEARPIVHSDRGGHYRWPGWNV